MFTENSIRGLEFGDDSPYVQALARKLLDIDLTRIDASDQLVIRKAVFGLLEVVADLERRVNALEGPAAQAESRGRLDAEIARPTPDDDRLH